MRPSRLPAVSELPALLHSESADAARAPDGPGPGATSGGPRTLAPPAAEAERVRELLVEALAPATRRAYASDWRYFLVWARAAAPELAAAPVPVPVPVLLRFLLHHTDPMPERVAAALEATGVSSAAGRLAPSTLDRRLAALTTIHRLLGATPDPTRAPEVRDLLRAARRRAVRAGYRPRKVQAAHRAVLEAMLATCDDSLGGVRDQALLLFGFASGGRRRSEIARARVEELEEIPEGYLFWMAASKTEPEGPRPGSGGALPVLDRAGRALTLWLERSGVTQDEIFRAVDRWGHLGGPLSPRAVAEIVRRRAAAAGYPPERFAGHSLRSGFLTAAGRAGHPLQEAMVLSRHRSIRIAAGYHQTGSVLRNPTAHLAD